MLARDIVRRDNLTAHVNREAVEKTEILLFSVLAHSFIH